MKTLVILYTVLFVAGNVGGAWVARPRGGSGWARWFGVLGVSAYWLLGLLAFLLPSLQVLAPLLLVLLWPALLFEAYDATRDYLEEPPDLELSPRANQVANVATTALGLACDAPAVIVMFVVLRSSLGPVALVGLGLCLVAGIAVALALPCRDPWATAAQEELSAWLEHELEQGRVPDEIELIDRRMQSWPDHEGDVQTFLLAYRYGDSWNVGLVGPCTFAFAGRALSRDDVDGAYDEYRDWYRQERIEDLSAGA